jgi:hypothetical protein
MMKMTRRSHKDARFKPHETADVDGRLSEEADTDLIAAAILDREPTPAAIGT